MYQYRSILSNNEIVDRDATEDVDLESVVKIGGGNNKDMPVTINLIMNSDG